MTSHRYPKLLSAGLIAALIALAPAASAEPPPDAPRYVKAKSVNVRKGPGTSNTVVAALSLGAEVRIYAVSGDWSRISPPGKPEQWIFSPLLQPERPAPAKTKAPDQRPKIEPAATADTPDKRSNETKGSPRDDAPGTPARKADDRPALPGQP